MSAQGKSCDKGGQMEAGNGDTHGPGRGSLDIIQTEKVRYSEVKSKTHGGIFVCVVRRINGSKYVHLKGL